MEPDTLDVEMGHWTMPEAVTSSNSSNNHQPFLLQAVTKVATLSVVFLISLLGTAVAYKTLNLEAVKNFRICVFLRFLAVVEVLMIVVTLGLPWVALLLPPDYTYNPCINNRLCSLHIFSTLSLGDVGIYVLVMAGLERLYTRLEKPWYSLDAIFFTSHHHVRVTCIFARLMLLFWVAVVVILNLPLLYEKWFESTGVAYNPKQCPHIRTIIDGRTRAMDVCPSVLAAVNFTGGCLHILLAAVFAACTGSFLARAYRSTHCVASQQPEEPTQKAGVRNLNVSSLAVETLSSNERKTLSVESSSQNATQDMPGFCSLTSEFCTLYRTIKIFNWRGYTLGMHLVPCAKNAVPTKNQELYFDCKVLVYTFLYLSYEIPQLAPAMGGPIAKSCGVALVKFLDVIDDILSSSRPASVIFTQPWMSALTR